MGFLTKEETIFGIDFGSSTISAAVALKDKSWRILKAGKIKTKGLSAGVVSSIDIATRDLSKLIRELEDATGVSATKCVVGIRGKNINAANSVGVIKISRSDKTITAEDVESVISIAKDTVTYRDREIFDFIVQDFGIDDEWGIKSPEGMDADKLEVKITVFVAHKSQLSNIKKVLSNLDLDITGVYYSVAVVASMALSDEEKSIGSLLLDVSDTTSAFMYYYGNSIRAASEIMGGISDIKTDLTYDLNASRSEVERLIDEYGYVPMDEKLQSNKITYMNYSGEKTLVDIYHYSDSLKSRTAALLDTIKEKLMETLETTLAEDKRLPYIKIPYIAISGDMCGIKGISHIVKEVFEESSVRIIGKDSLEVEFMDSDSSIITPALLIPYMELKSYHGYTGRANIFGRLFKWLR